MAFRRVPFAWNWTSRWSIFSWMEVDLKNTWILSPHHGREIWKCGFISTVRPTVHITSSRTDGLFRKRSQTARIWKHRLYVFVTFWKRCRHAYLLCDFPVRVLKRKSKLISDCFSEQVMSADKYSSIFSRQLEAIACLNCNYKCRSYSKRND